MFAKIYHNEIRDSAMHLAEEAGELDEAARNLTATHNKECLEKVIEELVDLVTNIFAVANCMTFDLTTGLVKLFSNGCPKCHKVPCKCGYLPEDKPI